MKLGVPKETVAGERRVALVPDTVAKLVKDGHEVLVLKLDTDRNPATPNGFGIRGIPTMILFEHGRETARQTGAAPRDQIDALLARTPSQ